MVTTLEAVTESSVPDNFEVWAQFGLKIDDWSYGSVDAVLAMYLRRNLSRERLRVLEFVAAGLNNSGIAEWGLYSESGVSNHVSEINAILKGRPPQYNDRVSLAIVYQMAFPSDCSLPCHEISDIFTPREKSVVKLIAKGFNNQAIASRIGIKKGSVECYINGNAGLYCKIDLNGNDRFFDKRVWIANLYNWGYLAENFGKC